MSAFPFRIVGFDLDGTLLDTSGDLAAAVNHALAAIDRAPLPVETVLHHVGGGTRTMLASVLGEAPDGALVERLLPLLLGFYERNLTVHTRPYPGTIAALDDLAARGVTLGVVTNKLEALSRALLEATGLADRFACVIGGDTLARAKPDPAPIYELVARCGGARAAFVGDSAFDVAAAKAAQVPVVACCFGFLGEAADTLGADAVIRDYAALIPALERL